LEIIIQSFEKHNLIINWIDFYESCITKSWNIKTIFSKIEYSLLETMGREHSEEVLKRLKYYILTYDPKL